MSEKYKCPNCDKELQIKEFPKAFCSYCEEDITIQKCDWCKTMYNRDSFGLYLRDKIYTNNLEEMYFCHYECLVHWLAENQIKEI